MAEVGGVSLVAALRRVPRGGLVVLAGFAFKDDPALLDRIINAAPPQSGTVLLFAFIDPQHQTPARWPDDAARAYARRDPTARFTLLAMTTPPPGPLAEADLVLRWDGHERGWTAAFGAPR